jgi:oligopeptide transport system substrate-binding protein
MRGQLNLSSPKRSSTVNEEEQSMRLNEKSSTRSLPIIFCLLTVILVACGSPSPAPTLSGKPTKAPLNKQIFINPDGGSSDINSFDPALAPDIPSINAIEMAFTGLVALDAHLALHPQLAQFWHESPDGLTWTFNLRSDLKFSDGTALTSQDVAYSIDRALQPATMSGTAPYYLRYIKDSDLLSEGKIKTIIGDSILTPDPNTLVIKANQKVVFFLDALTYPCSFVVEKKVVEKWGKSWTDHLTDNGGQGGDGPFKVQEYTHGRQIVFVPNPNYYGPKPLLAKVIVPFYKSSDSTYFAYQTGQIDSASVPVSNLEMDKAHADFHEISELTINYYAMNYLVKPFDNIKIRQAFALAINKDDVVHAAWKDSLYPTNHIVPKGMSGYNPNLTGPDGVSSTKGDPVKAQQLFKAGLQEEGWTSASQLPPITLTYSSGSSQAFQNELAIVQQDWQSILEVNVKLSNIDFNKLLNLISSATNNPRGLQFWAINWFADYPDPEDWTTLQFDKGSSNNNMNYGQNNAVDTAQQQQVQQELEAADINPDSVARLQVYMRAEQQLVNDVAWLPMEQATNTYLLKPCVVGYVINEQALTPPDDWGNTYISTQTPCATV